MSSAMAGVPARSVGFRVRRTAEGALCLMPRNDPKPWLGSVGQLFRPALLRPRRREPDDKGGALGVDVPRRVSRSGRRKRTEHESLDRTENPAEQRGGIEGLVDMYPNPQGPYQKAP